MSTTCPTEALWYQGGDLHAFESMPEHIEPLLGYSKADIKQAEERRKAQVRTEELTRETHARMRAEQRMTWQEKDAEWDNAIISIRHRGVEVAAKHKHAMPVFDEHQGFYIKGEEPRNRCICGKQFADMEDRFEHIALLILDTPSGVVISSEVLIG